MIHGVRTIYVDMDDVLCEMARHCLYVVEREFGRRVGFEELVNFDLGVSCGLKVEERAHLYRTIHEPEELLRLAPIAGAIATLHYWAGRGYEIDVVTGRPPSAFEPSQAWLSQHRVPYSSFTIVDKYGRFDNADPNAITLSDLTSRRYAWAVEDSLPMAQFLANDMDLPVILIDRPWNRTEHPHRNVTRHTDWKTIDENQHARLAE